MKKILETLKKKWAEYLLEILVIMIGIISAYMLNDWRETQVNNKLAINYINDLKRDVKSDINKLENIIDSNNRRIAQIDTIYQTFIEQERLSKEETYQFINRHLILSTESYFMPDASTIKQIESSSHGSLIRNKILRDKIFRYYSINERNEKNNEESIQLYQHNFISEYLFKALMVGESAELKLGSSLGIPYLDYKGLLQNKNYMFAIQLKKTNCATQNRAYNRIKSMAEELLELINSEE